MNGMRGIEGMILRGRMREVWGLKAPDVIAWVETSFASEAQELFPDEGRGLKA